MYPRDLLESEVKSRGEIKVFEALRDGLSDEWEAYHSASWVVRDHAEGAKDGEIDFVLCHPDEGIVCLEVKGGGLECRYGEWYRLENGRRERMRDPFTQAIDHTWALRRKIDEVDGWRAKELVVVHAVALPDVTVHELALAPDAPREILLDRSDVRDIGPAFERMLAFHRGSREKRRPPGPDGVAMVRELLAPVVQIEVPMAERFLEEESALITLTHQQSVELARLRRNQRMVVYGCAGSGKTMLAVEHARRLARDGRKVLFVCFNKGLAEHLKASEKGSGVDFSTFHGLCGRLAHSAKVKLPHFAKGEEPPPEYYGEVLPNALVEAVVELGPQYDALLVDEAQDLHDAWYEALTGTLHDDAKAAIWLFMDDNQRIYEGGFRAPPAFFATELDVNCRNTQEIHNEVIKLYTGEIHTRVLGPAGRPIEFMPTDDQARTVAGVLERLCGREEIPTQDVVVLSAHGWENSAIARALPGRFRLTEKARPRSPSVRFSSIRGFKGLESPVVILCELEDLDEATKQQQLYVGMSRAKNHCVIVAPNPPGDGGA